jgi:hypothetical protein
VADQQDAEAAAAAQARVEGTADDQLHACAPAATAAASSAAARAKVVVIAQELLNKYRKQHLLQRLQADFLQELKQTPPAQTLAMSAEDSGLVLAALKSCARSCYNALVKLTSDVSVEKGAQCLEYAASRVGQLDELLELAEQHESVLSGVQSTSAQQCIDSWLASACSRLETARKQLDSDRKQRDNDSKQLQMSEDAVERGRTVGGLSGSITKEGIRASRQQAQLLLRAVALSEDMVRRVGGDLAMQRVCAHKDCISHHTGGFRPKLKFQKAAADRSEAPMPTMQCSCCGQFLHISHSLVVHECPAGKEVTAAALDSLAAAARCAARPDGGCFLCDAPVGEGDTHTCHSPLWTLLLVDQSHLSHANPYRVCAGAAAEQHGGVQATLPWHRAHLFL